MNMSLSGLQNNRLMEVRIKRIYSAPSQDDGLRVLVDRLWPRGIKKENAHIDLWIKNIAPSTELRKWFSHDVNKWTEFQEKYKQELADNPSFDSFKEQIADKPVVTLLFGAKDEEHNNAVVLASLLN